MIYKYQVKYKGLETWHQIHVAPKAYHADVIVYGGVVSDGENELEKIIEGSLKWDGCFNANLSAGDTLTHFCGPAEAYEYAALVQCSYVLVQRHLENYDSCSDTDELPEDYDLEIVGTSP